MLRSRAAPPKNYSHAVFFSPFAIKAVNCFSNLETSGESLSVAVLLLYSKYQLLGESFSRIVHMHMSLCMHTCKTMEFESTVSYKTGASLKKEGNKAQKDFREGYKFLMGIPLTRKCEPHRPLTLLSLLCDYNPCKTHR